MAYRSDRYLISIQSVLCADFPTYTKATFTTVGSHIFLSDSIFPRKQFPPRGDSFFLHKDHGTRHDNNFTRKRFLQWEEGAFLPRAISYSLQIVSMSRAYLKLLEVVPAPLVHPHHRVGRLTWQRQILALVDDVLVVDHTERTRHVEHWNERRKRGKESVMNMPS